MLRTLLVLLLALAPQPDQDTLVVAGTRALVDALFAGRTAALVGRFDDELKAALSEDQLKQAVATVVQQAGAYEGITDSRVSMRDGIRLVVLTCDFANGPVDVSVAWDGSHVVGMNIRPAATVVEYTPPAYVKMPAFTEREITVDAGTGWPLPGTITMPVGDGPFPAVVLVHGSGPGDRDESIGPNRPFRDIAWGLASRGIAVVRYDKRTLVHRSRIDTLTSMTVKDETIDDALAAAALARRTDHVRSDRVFVLGHSLGGMLAPRIGAADPALAGLVVLAGATRPLEDAIVMQTRYLASLDGAVSEAEKLQITDAESIAAKVKTLKPGDPPLTGILASAPVSYMLDLRGYDPPSAARALRMPLLVLQGERDYQVTMDDFRAWKAALGERPSVRFQSYPALNHLFTAGTGPSGPAEYRAASHVDAPVVDDIATWVLAR